MPEKMLDEVKNYLDITWETTKDEDDKLIGMIARGMNALSGKIGQCEFEKETQEKSLLLIYVMYERSGALNDFWTNYQSEIISLQMDRWMSARKKI